MARIEKTVFVSYRRTNVPWALAIYQRRTHHGYDVFFDFTGIGCGNFDQVNVGINRAAHSRTSTVPLRGGTNATWTPRQDEAERLRFLQSASSP